MERGLRDGLLQNRLGRGGGKKGGRHGGRRHIRGGRAAGAVPPFEIYPDSLYAAPAEVRSLIHARCVAAEEVYRLYGKRVAGGDVEVFGGGMGSAAVRHDAVTVIERYELPSEAFPNGRLVTVGGGELLYYGELPYINGENGKRAFPFVRQACRDTAGCFFGTSVVERLDPPSQRAYNAVKNRKHEFLNRLSLGVLNVESARWDARTT